MDINTTYYSLDGVMRGSVHEREACDHPDTGNSSTEQAV